MEQQSLWLKLWENQKDLTRAAATRLAPDLGEQRAAGKGWAHLRDWKMEQQTLWLQLWENQKDWKMGQQTQWLQLWENQRDSLREQQTLLLEQWVNQRDSLRAAGTGWAQLRDWRMEQQTL